MPSTLKLGSQGPEVVELQTALNHGRSAHPPLKEDGVFGRVTLTRVQEFQRTNGLIPDGVVGPQTWARLQPASVDPVQVWAAIQPFFASLRAVSSNDVRRLALVNELETAFAARCQPRDAGWGLVLNPYFVILVVILLLMIWLFWADPVHRRNLERIGKMLAEAVAGRGEEAQRKAREAAKAMEEFWTQATPRKSECMNGVQVSDPRKYAECVRRFQSAYFAAFMRIRTLVMQILVQQQRLPDFNLVRVELGRAAKAFVDAFNDLMRCLGCPELPYPYIPNLPLGE